MNYLPCAHLADGWCWPCVRDAVEEMKEDCAKIADANGDHVVATAIRENA